MLLNNLAHYLRRKSASDPTLHVVTAAGGDDEGGFPLPDAEPHVARAELVEGRELRAIDLGGTDGHTGFTCFLDGIQRGQVVYYHELVPVVYGYAAAVVRERRERRPGTRWLAASEKLYLPYDWLDPAELQAAGVATADCTPERELERDEMHPLMLKHFADQAVAKTRRDLETDLARRWMAEDEHGWLYLDGSTTSASEVAEHPRVVGVIKSHQTQYFPFSEQRKILALRAGERSSVFRPASRAFTPVYSWYVRLRPFAGQDLYFGLVRVEAPATTETLDQVNQISRWLLAETQPLALPDGRWDRMIYPIRDCEEFLRSRAPTHVALEGMLGALKG